MVTDKFFEESKEQSIIKKTIVSKYFWLWAKVITPSVKKHGNKRAKRVLDTEEKAVGYMDAEQLEYPGWKIEERPGESTRCLYYCNVAKFCSFGKALVKPKEEEVA